MKERDNQVLQFSQDRRPPSKRRINAVVIRRWNTPRGREVMLARVARIKSAVRDLPPAS